MPRFDRTARFGRDARRAEFLRQRERAFRVVDANLPIVPIRLDPRRVPVFLPWIVDRVHHEGVDVRDRQPIVRKRLAHCLLVFLEQIGRPGVRHIGHDLDALVTDPGNACDRLGKRKMQVGIGAEREFHEENCMA